MLTHTEVSTKTSSRTVSTTLTNRDFERITELVDDGFYNDVDEFVKVAVIDKLGGMEPITLRDIPYEQQRQEIIDYAEAHGEVDAIEISDALLLDAFEVNDIMVELIKEGILEEL